MPSSYAGDPDLFPTAANIPSDGDEPDAAAWTVSLEALLDRTVWLRARILSEPIVRVLSETPHYRPAQWEPSVGAGYLMSIATGVTGTDIVWPLRLPQGARVDYFRLYITPTSGHIFPIQFGPGLAICRMAHATGTLEVLAMTTEAPVNSSYEVRHEVQVAADPGTPITIDNGTYAYFLLFRNEDGTNAHWEDMRVENAPTVAFDSPLGGL